MKKSVFKQALIVLLLGFVPQLGYADIPGIMNYQGYLSDTSGDPVDGTIDITFSIPNTTWKEAHTGVSVKQGVFGVLLGNKMSLTGVDFSQQHSLRIEYDGKSQTVPFAVVPYALYAKKVEQGSSSSGSNGSIFTRWGNGTAPNGTTLLYTGFAFNEHYTQSGGSAEPICVKAGDVGAPGPGSRYGDLLYPLGTGDSSRMPPGISPQTEIKCAVVYSESPTFEMWGSQTCPTGWSATYTGYSMGAYYKHSHQSNRKCVDNSEYDYSVANPNWGDIWYGTVLYSNQDVGIYETNRYLKCAVCAKD
jgi:hypothetical protein